MSSCPICNNKKDVNFRCDYKYEILEDKKYFDHLDIYKCNKCDFSFTHPMPKSSNLDFFLWECLSSSKQTTLLGHWERRWFWKKNFRG